MYHHVSTVLDRADEDRSKCVVNDKERVMAMSYLCKGIEIADISVRISKCLAIDHLSVRTDSSLYCSEIAEIHNSVFHALGGESVGNEVVTATVEIVGCHDVVAVLQHILQGVSHCCCAGSHCKTSYTAFQSGNSVFENALGGIGQTTVYIACVA